ncbi:ALEURONE LAYER MORPHOGENESIS PROTEIN [Salix viminalis]|uniref:ALEURONE LAYER MORPHOGENESIS PROTEIN n=1 Tax=Salix viminalis TaxID=40686 RepID=A0A9Q0YZA9_SALVM|nr:ALEURONE LAYER MORPHOGENESIS PROTEIN [Salix viminalis]
MTSIAMDVADACPAEDFIVALIQYLGDPKLQRKSSDKGATSQIEQESIAKQLYAVVLLYNYYHRKQHPQLEFLCFENFCKIAVVVKPALLAHIRLLQRSNDTKSQTFPLLEERIMEACSISMSLDASEDDLNIEGWPISRVAVLLIDSKKENCFLQFGSITEGVWSVIEKDVDVSNDSSEGSTDFNHVNKKKRIIRKPLKCKSRSNGAGFQQFAFLAVKEATGIDQSDLVVLDSHVTYSTRKEKTAAYFYIIQFTKADYIVALQTPIKNVINSLQGPLAIQNSSWWMHTSVVEYFHLLTYAEFLSDWLLREGLSNGLQVQRVRLETINVSSSDRTERPCEAEISERFHNHVNDGATELPGSETTPRSLKHNDNNGCGSEINLSKQNSNDSENLISEINSSKQNGNDRCCMVDLTDGNCGEKGSTSGDNIKADIADRIISQKGAGCRGAVVANGKKNSSKDKELSRAAMTVVLSKRDKLSLQQRDIEDQIAQCDKNIETILKGGEDNLSLKIESLIEGFNHRSLRSVSQERTYEDQCLPPTVKGKRLPDIMLDLKNSCQDLDGVCYENNWILPSYHVSSQDGGFLAAVTVKGTGFECSSEGELCPCPREARESAAKRVFAKLGNMPNMSW